VADEDLEVAVEADDAPNDDEMVRCVTDDKKSTVQQDILSNSCPVLTLLTCNLVE
jgi:hypothetical protein